MSDNPGEGPPQMYGIAFVIFLAVIGLLALWFSMVVVRGLGLSFEKAFLASMWRLAFFEFLLIAFPVAISIEIMWSRWKKRRLRVHSIMAIALPLFAYLLLLSLIGFVFENMFPDLSFANGHFPGLTGLMVGLMLGLPLLIVVFAGRTRSIKDYIRRAFE